MSQKPKKENLKRILMSLNSNTDVNFIVKIREWRTVSKYKNIKLEEYLSDRTFMDSAQMCQNFSHVALETYAFILDKVVKGNGFVEQEINSDVTLKDAISREMIEIVTKITNRIQILILTSVNICNGKIKAVKRCFKCKQPF